LLFAAGIDPPDDAEVPPKDDAASWPQLSRVLAYRDRVRDELRERLEEPKGAEILAMVLEHELMHHETLLYMLKELPASDKKPPADLAAAPTEPESKAVRSRLGIPAGPARLGTDSGDFRWDNERPEHEVDTEAFEIDSLPVTNRDFREF